MKAIAGVALAAVMTCGLAGGTTAAQALVIDTTFLASGDAAELGGSNFLFHFDGYRATLTITSYYNSCYEEEDSCTNRYGIVTKAVAEGIGKVTYSVFRDGTFFTEGVNVSFSDPSIKNVINDSRYGESYDYFSGSYEVGIRVSSDRAPVLEVAPVV